MHRLSVLLLSALLLVLCSSACAAPGARQAVAAPVAAPATPVVRVDPRVELATAMARLAGYEEYQAPGLPAYDAAVERHFGPFRGHASLQVLRRLREERGIGYNAPVELALAAEPGTWALAALPASLDARWDEAGVRDFLDAAARFAHDTDAAAFFAAQQPQYAEVEAAVRRNLAGRLDLGWYATQMPPRPMGAFTVVPALLAGPNSYGTFLRYADGHEAAFGVLATPPHQPGQAVAYPADAQLSLLVHEFHHPYMNPWADAHAALLLPAAEALYAAVSARMESLAYGAPRILLYESLVRANTQRYLRAHGEDAVLRRVLAEDRGKGFPWTPALADLLEARAGDRFDAGTAAAVAALLADWARDGGRRIAEEEARLAAERQARLASGPQLQQLVPADGATVGAGDALLELHFDRPMAKGVAIFGDTPEVTGKPAWSDDGRVLRVPVRMQAGARYRMQLNTEENAGFRSAEGEPLAPREWRFEVRAGTGLP